MATTRWLTFSTTGPYMATMHTVIPGTALCGSSSLRSIVTFFAADPARYAPQYGGYCAFAVANRTTAHGSPKQWAVVNEPVSEQQSAGEKALGPGPARAHPGWRPELAPDPEARVAG